LAIQSGRIRRDPEAALAARVDVVSVDLTGAISEGCRVRSGNPILITLKVVLEPF